MPDFTELTVLVIEHQDVLFHSLEQFVLKLVPSAHIEHIKDLNGIGESVDGSSQFGLVILDSDIPGFLTSSSRDVIVQSLARSPLVYLTNTFREAELSRLLRIGINAYLPKTIPTPAMIAGFGLALCGQKYFAPRHMPGVGPDFPGNDTDGEFRGELSPGDIQLTKRQRQALQLLALGQTNAQIAQSLQLAESTVRLHLREAYRRLGVTNRIQAANKAARIFTDSFIGATPNDIVD